MRKEFAVPQISSGQAVSLLILSRLFVLLIFVPQENQSVNGTPSLLGVIFGFVLTILLLIPAYLLLKKYPEMDLYQIARQQSKMGGKLAAGAFFLVSIAIVVETAAQFTVFLTDAVYPEADSVWVVLAFCGAAFYLAYLGLEALGRSCVLILFLSLGVSFLMGLGLWKFFDSLNLITPFYDGAGPVILGSISCAAQNVELMALGLLVSNLNDKDAKKAFFRYHSIVTVVLFVIGFSAIVVMGHYGQTRNFPIYSMFVLSGSNVFYRLDYLLITMWTAAALLRASLYLLLARRMLNEISGRRLKNKALFLSLALSAVFSLIISQRLEWLRILYRCLSSGIPVLVMTVILPLLLLWNCRRKKGGTE